MYVHGISRQLSAKAVKAFFFFFLLDCTGACEKEEVRVLGKGREKDGDKGWRVTYMFVP